MRGLVFVLNKCFNQKINYLWIKVLYHGQIISNLSQIYRKETQ